MIVTGRPIVIRYLRQRAGHRGIRAAERQFEAWWAEATRACWTDPAAVKAAYRSASILKGSRVVFNISGNRFRLVTRINYAAEVVEIRFFGTHEEYDRIDAETI